MSIQDSIASELCISTQKAHHLVDVARYLYEEKMTQRFSKLRVAERIKRTNPFLLRIRGVDTIGEWASLQVQSALFASEEEAVGHLLEAIARTCHPDASEPEFTDDFDYEVRDNESVYGYQVKMSWDCMPMSSRKNLSNTIRRLTKEYATRGLDFTGYFAPCYGRAKTSKPPGQDYITLASREFWQKVGDGDPDFDVKVGSVCNSLCSDARKHVAEKLVPNLVEALASEVAGVIGNNDGSIDFEKLFRAVNK